MNQVGCKAISILYEFADTKRTARMHSDAHPVQTFLLEFTATFILVYTVFATAVDRCGAAKNAAPLTIGLAVAVGIFAVGPFTGGAINPARTIGAATAFWEMGNSPVYVAATLAGGVAAAKVYDTLYLWDVQPATPEERDE
ncbi:MAG: aquaporin [Promethearchaeia archaeon]